MAGSWLPKAEGALVTWYVNYHNKLTTLYNATFGLSPGDIGSLNNDLAALQHMVAQSGIYKTHTQDVNEYKANLIYGPGPIGAFPTNPVLPVAPTVVAADIIARVDAMVARLKGHANYTTAIGEDIGIEPPAVPPPGTTVTLKPPKALPDSRVEIGYSLEGNDGIYMEVSVDGGAWEFLGADRHSPMVDTRPPAVAGKSEVRRYRARPLDGDTPVGDWSAIVQVSTIP